MRREVDDDDFELGDRKKKRIEMVELRLDLAMLMFWLSLVSRVERP